MGQLSQRDLAYDTGFTLQPGTHVLKFLARENEAGKMGTFETKFIVPDLTTESKTLPIGFVAPSSQREKLEAAQSERQRPSLVQGDDVTGR